MILKHRVALVFAGAIATALAFVGFLSVYFIPLSIDPERRLDIPSGASLRYISRSLAGAGVIRSAPVFSVMMRMRGEAHLLQAGEYVFSGRLSMADIADQLRDGRVFLYPITIVEGITSAQLADQLNAATFFAGPEISDIEEGSTLPDTYHFPRGTDRAQAVRHMQQAQTQLLDAVWDSRYDDLPLRSKHEAVILASIVERETAIAAERPLVASVFINRLKNSMRLQSDPTIIYGLTRGRGLGRPIRLSELRKKTLYNTYLIDGLPPTPISHPGRDALIATLRPEATDYLYFVADGMGGHAFSRSLLEHNKNVQKWRSNRR